MDELIITCAVTGAETTREKCPGLPHTPTQIAEETARAHEAGASVVHLHVRHEDGTPTQDRNTFAEAIELIRERCPILIEVTTGGAAGMTDDERLSPLELRPPMASLDCGSVNFGDEVLLNSFPQMQAFARQMNKFDVKPTFECFDLGQVNNAKMLIDKGLVEPPYYFSFVMGVPGGVPATARNLFSMADQLPEKNLWTSIAVGGRASALLHPLAIGMGGHVRVGFEDSIHLAKGVVAESNADLVKHIVKLAGFMGRTVADVEKTKELLGIVHLPQKTES